MVGRVCRARANCVPEVLETVVEIALSIARQNRDQRRLGALFVVGDEERVLKKSIPLILDPLAGHPKDAKDIRNANVQGTIKELAKLDGAFIISTDGYVLSAARYIEASYRNINLPMGFGSRHMAAASISRETNAIAIVVSESDGVVRIFDDGELIAEIMPGIWELDKIKPHISGKYERIINKEQGITMIIKE